jgi:hypothetical protein
MVNDDSAGSGDPSARPWQADVPAQSQGFAGF